MNKPIATPKLPPRKPGKALPRNDARAWLICAAAAAWHAAHPWFNDPEAGGEVEEWDVLEGNAEMARFYYWRHKKGEAAIDDLRRVLLGPEDEHEEDDDEGVMLEDDVLPKPKGFRTWRHLAAELFEELGLDPSTARLREGQKLEWSVYHLQMALKKTDPLFDAAGLDPPPEARVKSIQIYGGIWEPIMACVRKLELWVADGRQRRNGTLVVNERTLDEYYGRLVNHLRYVETQKSLPRKAKLADIKEPHVILQLPVVIHPLERGLLLKNLANTQRKVETALEEARAIWELMKDPQFRGDPQRLADLRGCSTQTIRNAQSLQDLTLEWMQALLDKRIWVKTGYRLGVHDKKKQAACWRACSKDTTGKLDALVVAWLDGAPTEKKAATDYKTKARAFDRAGSLDDALAELPETTESKAVRQVLAALRGDADAAKQLPEPWQVGLGFLVLAAKPVSPHWAHRGFTEDERQRWEQVGVKDFAEAEDLREAGLTPELAGLQCPGAVQGVTIGAAYASGFVTSQEAVRHAKNPQGQLSLPEAPIASELPSPIVSGIVGYHRPIARGAYMLYAQDDLVMVKGAAGVNHPLSKFGVGFVWNQEDNRHEKKWSLYTWEVAVRQLEELEPHAPWLQFEEKVVRHLATLSPAASGWGGSGGPRLPLGPEEPLPGPSSLLAGVAAEDLGLTGEPGAPALEAVVPDAAPALEAVVPASPAPATAAPRRRGKKWPQFMLEEQAAWEDAGATTRGRAAALRAAGLKPEQCKVIPAETPERAIAVLGDDAKALSFGGLYEQGVIEIPELQSLITHAAPAAEVE